MSPALGLYLGEAGEAVGFLNRTTDYFLRLQNPPLPPISRLTDPPKRKLASSPSISIVRLTPPERLALIAQLWDSLEHEQVPLTTAQEAELERRLASLDEDRRSGVTWASLKAELEQRCPLVYSVIFTQALRAELIKAQDWYEGEATGL